MKIDKQPQYRQSLGSQVENIEQEARMVLPGIQTLFGFQLMVAFSSGFKENITANEQYIHLLSLLLVAISGILVVAPAAYHRQANHQISEHFVKLSSRFLTLALAPFAIGTCLDIYLVSRMMTDSILLAQSVTAFLFCLYAGIWFIYPRIRGYKLSKLVVHDLPEKEK
jgi:hypothetical protein